MRRLAQPGIVLFALGMVGLGVLALVVGDFAMGWQPVPAWVPGRTALAYAAGALMLLCGVGLLFRATATWASRILFVYLALWMLLKAPALVVAPRIEGVWLGFGELAALLCGGWALFAEHGGICDTWATGSRGVRLARIVFALAILPIGLSHMVYLRQTVDLVPAWLPFRPGWAYLTGLGQIASGLGLLFGVAQRLAAAAEAVQISLYTILI